MTRVVTSYRQKKTNCNDVQKATPYKVHIYTTYSVLKLFRHLYFVLFWWDHSRPFWTELSFTQEVLRCQDKAIICRNISWYAFFLFSNATLGFYFCYASVTYCHVPCLEGGKNFNRIAFPYLPHSADNSSVFWTNISTYQSFSLFCHI